MTGAAGGTARARAFWRDAAAGRLPERRRVWISPELERAMHPGMDRTPEADYWAFKRICAVIRDKHRARPTRRCGVVLDPAGMTPERALQIALAVLDR